MTRTLALSHSPKAKISNPVGENAADIPDNARLYLRPVQLSHSVQLSLPLAGGPIHFSALDVIIQGGGKRVVETTFPVTRLDDLKATLPDDLSSAFDVWLDRLTAARKSFSGKPAIMGILNITPDSFSDGGDFLNPAAARKQAQQIFADGADILDIGAESTRPGAVEVPEAEELKRLQPVLEIVKDLPGPVSLDTRKAIVMEEGLKKGIAIINDVSALTFDAKSPETAKKAGHVILMHAGGDPATMQENPIYNDVLLDVYDFLNASIGICEKAGIGRDKIIIDPGIGFGKTLEHNVTLLQGLSLFQGLGVPVMIGVSRKRFIGAITGEDNPKNRLAGSLAATLFAAAHGVQIIRCHDVQETRCALDTRDALQ